MYKNEQIFIISSKTNKRNTKHKPTTMDNQHYNQHYNNTIDIQTENTDQLYPLERTECNNEYWNDLMVEALGPNSHDSMPSNIEGDFESDHQPTEL